MKNKPNPSSRPRQQQPESTPEYNPPPGDVPKQFPEKQPMSGGGIPDASAKRDTGRAEHAGENREVESGLDNDDPEHPVHAEGDEAMR